MISAIEKKGVLYKRNEPDRLGTVRSPPGSNSPKWLSGVPENSVKPLFFVIRMTMNGGSRMSVSKKTVKPLTAICVVLRFSVKHAAVVKPGESVSFGLKG